jgi:hypothetical protein
MTYLFSADIAEQDRRLKGFRANGDTSGKKLQSGEGHAWTASGTRVALPSRRRRLLKTTIASAAAAAAIAIALVAVAMFSDDVSEPVPAPEPIRVAAQDRAPATTTETANGEADAERPAAAQPTAAEPTETSVRLSFDLTPSEALIVLDGSRVVAGVDEITLPADGERHTVTCKAKGYLSKTVEVAADRDRELIFELVSTPRKIRKKKTKKTFLVPNPY